MSSHGSDVAQAAEKRSVDAIASGEATVEDVPQPDQRVCYDSDGDALLPGDPGFVGRVPQDAPKPVPAAKPNSKARRAARRLTAKLQAQADDPRGKFLIKPSKKWMKGKTKEQIEQETVRLNKSPPVEPVAPESMQRLEVTHTSAGQKKRWVNPPQTGKKGKVWVPEAEWKRLKELERQEKAARLAKPTPEQVKAWHAKWDRKVAARAPRRNPQGGSESGSKVAAQPKPAPAGGKCTGSVKKQPNDGWMTVKRGRATSVADAPTVGTQPVPKTAPQKVAITAGMDVPLEDLSRIAGAGGLGPRVANQALYPTEKPKVPKVCPICGSKGWGKLSFPTRKQPGIGQCFARGCGGDYGVIWAPPTGPGKKVPSTVAQTVPKVVDEAHELTRVVNQAPVPKPEVNEPDPPPSEVGSVTESVLSAAKKRRLRKRRTIQAWVERSCPSVKDFSDASTQTGDEGSDGDSDDGEDMSTISGTIPWVREEDRETVSGVIPLPPEPMTATDASAEHPLVPLPEGEEEVEQPLLTADAVTDFFKEVEKVAKSPETAPASPELDSNGQPVLPWHLAIDKEGREYAYQKVGGAYTTGAEVPMFGVCEGLFGWQTRRKLQGNLHVVCPDLMYYIKLKFAGHEMKGQTRGEMMKYAAAWLKEHRHTLGSREHYMMAQSSVTAAMEPDFYDEQWRQRMKAVVTNHQIHAMAAARKGDLGKAGFFRRRRVLPGLTKSEP